jgi:hypothetical protein
VFERGPERGGWHGRVSDAHDGTAVAGARVHIVTASFTPSTEHVAITDTDGRFELPTLNAAREGARLEVSAPWHSTLVCPLPAPGRLGVAVVLRKRALLDRLIAWAKRHEVPPREPTPRQLAEWAERRGFGAAHSWAERVEQAAYGPAPVDEGREEALRAEEPSLAPTSSAETRPLDRNR